MRKGADMFGLRAGKMKAARGGAKNKAGALVVRPPENRCIQFWLLLTASVTSAVSFSSCSAVGL